MQSECEWQVGYLYAYEKIGQIKKLVGMELGQLLIEMDRILFDIQPLF